MNITNELKANICLQFGELDNVMSWCRENCNGKWMITTIGDSSGVDEYEFHFDSEDDLLIFRLRW